MRWIRRRSRVAQPPVNRFQRDPERHEVWPVLAVAVVAVLLLVIGVRQPAGLITLEGEEATSIELIQAFARGGLQFERATVVFDPAMFDDPDRLAMELDRANRFAERPLRERYRVNTGAADPCPT